MMSSNELNTLRPVDSVIVSDREVWGPLPPGPAATPPGEESESAPRGHIAADTASKGLVLALGRFVTEALAAIGVACNRKGSLSLVPPLERISAVPD